MQEEIKKALLRLEIEGKGVQRGKPRNILIIVIFAIFSYLVPYFYPQFSGLFIIDIFIIIFGGVYIINAIQVLYQPFIFKPEFHAFQEIARAIKILEESSEPIAYEEAYRCLNKAYKTLKKINLDYLEWYEKINQALNRFLENLQLIVLPAIANSNIKTEHLEEIALAVLSVDSSKTEAINTTLESEPSYKKYEPPPRKIEIFKRRFRESTIGNILYSLALGYGLVLAICLIYVVTTQQDFMIFARENPEIVVLGGLVGSGLTFWKTKPQSQWKSVKNKNSS